MCNFRNGPSSCGHSSVSDVSTATIVTGTLIFATTWVVRCARTRFVESSAALTRARLLKDTKGRNTVQETRCSRRALARTTCAFAYQDPECKEEEGRKENMPDQHHIVNRACDGSKATRSRHARGKEAGTARNCAAGTEHAKVKEMKQSFTVFGILVRR